MGKDRKQKLKEIAKEYPPLYTNYFYDDYIKDLLRGDIQFIENMCAKEPLNEEQLQEMLTSTDYLAEEKYDMLSSSANSPFFITSIIVSFSLNVRFSFSIYFSSFY